MNIRRFVPFLFLSLLCAMPLSAQGQGKRTFGKGHPFTVQELPAGKLKAKLGTLRPQARDKAMKWLHTLQFHEFDAAEHLRVDDDGGIFIVCPDNHGNCDGHHHDTPGSSPESSAPTADAGGAEPDETTEPPTVAYAAVPVASPPAYHSRPGATRHIYLDFNGGIVTGTAWNTSRGVSSWDVKVWSQDTDRTTFNDAEQAWMKKVWQRLAEDYAPFDVNVTTDTAFDPDNYTGNKDNVGWLMVCEQTDNNNVALPHSGSGGVAYVGVYGSSTYSPTYQPAWVSSTNGGGSESIVAEAASHEMGHNMGLTHDGTSTAAYYNGHGTGDTSWGPIMGTGYNRNVSQWSKGEYYDSLLTGTNPQSNADDLVIMSARVPYRADDHGGTMGTATPLSVTGGTISSTTPENDPPNANPANKGVIERNTDIDVFSFYTGAGNVQLNANPWLQPSGTRGGNLDILLELYNQAGTLVASSNPASQTNASIAATLAQGNYYLHVRNTGTGTPLASTPSGYTSYGSIGQYFISGTIVDASEPLAMDITRGGSPIAVNGVDGVSGTSVGTGTQLAYAISNTGGGQLELTTPVTISSQANCAVSVQTQPSGPVSAGGSTSLGLTVTPAAGGTWSFKVSIANNDPERNPYHWTVTGIAGSSTTVSFTPVADTYINDQATTTNYGTETVISLNNQTGGNPSGRAVVRGLLRFDLSSLPAGTTVQSAKLDFVQGNTNPGLIDIVEATASWWETSAISPPNPGATWSNSSGIYGSTSFGSATTGTTSGAAVPTITLNSSGLSKILNWVNSPSGNHGFGITTTNAGSGSSNWLALRSREHATTSDRPRLTLTYGGGPANLPLMTVSGSSGFITNGGSVSVSGSAAGAGSQSTYSIQNLGTSNLTLTTPVGISAASNCSVTVNTQPSSPVAPSGGTNLILTVTPTASGIWSATISVANNDPDKNPYTWTITGTASKSQATLALNGLAQTYDGNPRVVTATTSPAGLGYSVTYNGQPAAPTNAGNYAVVATITDPGYEGSTSGTLVVSKAPQTIAFAALDPVGNDQEPFNLTATASSGLPVSYTSSNTSVATVSVSTVSVVASGTTTITASQAGDGNFLPATNVARELEVVPVAPVANSGGPYKVLIGQSLSLNGSASAPSFNNTLTAYDWDLNNDGSFGDVTGVTPAAISFNDLINNWGMSQGLNTIQLRVTDSAAKTATISTTVELVLSLQWDSNGTLAGQTNGGGAWLNANQWWDGSANTGWVSGSNAVFGGPSTAGGTVTLASPTAVNAFTFNTFTGTYILGTSGQEITLTEGITMNAGSGSATIISPVTLGGNQVWANNSAGSLVVSGVIGGSGGIVKNGSGRVTFGTGGVANTYTGPTTINGGILSIANNSDSLGSGNLTLNGGVLGFYWSAGLIRTLGTGDNQVQIPGGESGFGGDGATGPTINLGATVVWGASGEGSATGFFNPSKFVLGSFDTTNAGATTFSSAINLNGATRTIVVPKGLNSGGNRSTISGAITGTGGVIKEGEGMLILGTSNTYNGATAITAGVLDFTGQNIAQIGGGSGRNISAAAGTGVRFNSPSNAVLNRLAETSAEFTVMTGATGNNLDFSSSTGANLPNAFLSNFVSNNGKTEYSGILTPSGDTYRLGSPYARGVLGMTAALADGANPRSLLVNDAGFGAVILTAANTFSGQTSLRVGGKLILGNNLALQNSPLDTASGTLYLSTGTAGSKVTNDSLAASPTFGGLTGSRNLSLVIGNGGSVVNNTTVMGHSAILGFTLNPGVGKSHTYSGAIANFATNTTLTKTGAGTQVLSGTNSHTGATNVNQGTLALVGGSQASPITVSSGASLGFTLGSPTTSSSTVNLTNGTVKITGTVDNVSDYRLITASGGITGTPALHSPISGYSLQTQNSGTELWLVKSDAPGPVASFEISAISSPQTVGTAITGITLTAKDASNNTATGFSGTVTFGGTGGFSGTSANFVGGVLSGVSVTPTVAGSDLTFTVDNGSGQTGTATIATINPGPVASFGISAISSPQTVGTPITGITVTARDSSGNTATGFTGTVTFGGTGGFTGTSANFVGGVLSGVSVTPTVAGSDLTFTVDNGSGQTGTATIATINPGPVASFGISAISLPQTVGTPITGITVTARDSSGNTATGFTGMVTFGGTGGFTGTSGSFVGGVLTGVSVTPTVAGSDLTFTVDNGSGQTGSATIATINPGPVASFEISPISSPQTVGTPITGITVTAKDASGNTATGFTGTVTFGGTGGFTGTSGSFVGGVLTGVSVTPTVAGSDLTFTVDDGSGHIGSATITTINPGPVASFEISPISSPQTVGTPITGITVTAKDASGNTATGFTGTVTFGGTGGFSGTSANFTDGVLSGVSVTPMFAGSDLTFTVDDGAGHTGSTVIASIESVYDEWSGSEGFTVDSNNDGVPNGVAWALGAADPSANATAILPTTDNTSDPDFLIYTFRRSDSANAAASIACQYGSDLASDWATAVHDGNDVIIEVSDNFYGSSPGVDKVEVKIRRTEAIGGKMFMRLRVIPNP